MNLQHLKTNCCPICGCRVVVKEAVEVSRITHRNEREIHTHCNGTTWESRTFLCGFEVKFIPNFERDELSPLKCIYNPEVIAANKAKIDTSKLIAEFIDKQSIDSESKERLMRHILMEFPPLWD